MIDKRCKRLLPFVFGTRKEAEEFIDWMMGVIRRSGFITAREIFETRCPHVCHEIDSYGWNNLSTVSVYKDVGGYVVEMPRAIYTEVGCAK